MKFKNTDPIDVTVVDYDPSWTAAFEEEARLIRDILQDDLIAVFHIGSTSVPGMKAKPIIDIMPVVLDIESVDGCRSRFEAIGYEAMGEFGIPGRRYFRKGKERRTHQVHMFQYDNTHDITRHLAFRDYLRSRADLRVVYGDLKSNLAERYPRDLGGYCDGKDDFVKRAEREALQWYWKAYDAASRFPPH